MGINTANIEALVLKLLSNLFVIQKTERRKKVKEHIQQKLLEQQQSEVDCNRDSERLTKTCCVSFKLSPIETGCLTCTNTIYQDDEQVGNTSVKNVEYIDEAELIAKNSEDGSAIRGIFQQLVTSGRCLNERDFELSSDNFEINNRVTCSESNGAAAIVKNDNDDLFMSTGSPVFECSSFQPTGLSEHGYLQIIFRIFFIWHSRFNLFGFCI